MGAKNVQSFIQVNIINIINHRLFQQDNQTLKLSHLPLNLAFNYSKTQL